MGYVGYVMYISSRYFFVRILRSVLPFVEFCNIPSLLFLEEQDVSLLSSSSWQKHLESFEMWCWRRMEKISWTDHVRNEEVLLRVNEKRSILHEIRKRKANWIGHILRRNCI